jgi:hypothetical protein
MSRDGSGALVVLVSAFVVVASAGCFVADTYQRARQLRTYTNMQAICGQIKELKLEHGDTLDASKIAEVLKSKAGGLDQWGHSLIYHSRRNEAGKVSDLLVSYGSDGKLDIKNIDGYYYAAPESVDDAPERDIVFRDCEPLLSAGK